MRARGVEGKENITLVLGRVPKPRWSLEVAALAPQKEWSLPDGAAGFARLIARLAAWPGPIAWSARPALVTNGT
jgi:hypothetical protein